MTQQLTAFCHIAKTAGTSLHHIFRRTYGARYAVVTKRYSSGDVVDASDIDRLKRRYRRLRAFGGHSVHPGDDVLTTYPDIDFVTMLRDPVSRCASHYVQEVRRGRQSEGGFLAWIQNDSIHDYQARRLCGIADAGAAIDMLENNFAFVGLVEKFDETVAMLRYRLPELAPPAQSRRYNTSPLADLKDEVLGDPESRAALIEANQEDSRLYAYVMSTIWPRQQSQVAERSRREPSEVRAVGRERYSLVKERVLLGIPRQLAKRGVKFGDPL